MPNDYMPNSPYKGLMPYSETDSLFFFGREEDRKIIIANLRSSPLTVLYGPSGVGKSSVLRAGVAYHLQQEAKQNLDDYGTLGFDVVVFDSWRDDPLTGLMQQVEADIRSLLDIHILEPIPLSYKLDQTLQAWTERIGEDDENGELFIILDQFEEYFLYHPNEDGEGTFAVEFPRIVNRSDLNVNFLISIDEDSLAKLDRFKARIPNLFDNYLRLKHLDSESAREAIEKPVAEYNRQAIILENFLNSKLTVLYGDSNTHKTSLLRDGIVQYLKQAKEPDKLSVKMVDCWYDKEQLRQLTSNSNNESDNQQLFVILDQFEECFWSHKQEDDPKIFVEKLLLQIKNSPSNVHWLISLNENAISELDSWKDLSPCHSYLHLFKDNQGKEKLEEVTLRQDSQQKTCQKSLEKFEIESALVEAVLDDFTVKESEIETALLQLVMFRLWEENVIKGGSLILREQTFTALGNFKNIAKDYLWSKLGEPLETQPNKEQNKQTDFPLSYQEKDIAASIFHQLVTPGGYKIAHTVSDLLNFANEHRKLRNFGFLQEKPIKDLLDKLLPVRIIRSVPDNRYEIFHDVLAQPILEWQQSFLYQQQLKESLKNADKEAIKTLMERYGKEHIVQNLITASLRLPKQDPVRQDEIAALLARQAYLFNQQYDTRMLNDVDEALRQAINRSYFSPILCEHGDEVSSVAFSPDSKLFASGSFDGNVRLWSLEQRKYITTIRTGTGLKHRGVLSIAISQDSQRLAVGCGDSTVRVFELNQPTAEPIILKGHTYEVWSVAFSPNGKLLASGSWDKTVHLWDLDQPPEKAEICRKYHQEYIWSVAFSPDGNILAAGCGNGTIWLRSLNHSKKLKLTTILSVNEGNSHQLKTDKLINDDEIFSVAFNADGTMLAAGSGDGKVRLWHLNQLNDPPTIMPGWEDLERSVVAFSKDGQWLASGSDNGQMTLWKLDYPTSHPILVNSLKAHYKGVSSVAFSQDGKWLGSSSWDWTARLWALQPSETESIVLQKHQQEIKTIAFSPDSQKLASGSYDQTLLLWDLDNPKSVPTLTPLNNEDGNVNSVAFSGDGKKLASGSADGKIRLWELDHPERILRSFKGHEQEISALAFSPHNPNILASGSWDNTVKIWDLSSSDSPKISKKHQGRISAMAFSPSDNILATSSEDRTVRLWNLNQPDAPSIASILLPQFDCAITSLAFNKRIYLDNYGYAQLLAISTDDQKIQVWDITPFQQHPEAEPIFLSEYSSSDDNTEIKGTPVVFSPDGYTLASGSEDHHVRLLDLRQPYFKPVELKGHRDQITTLAFSPDGKWIAAGSLDKTIRLWLVNTETLADMVCQKVWRNLTLQEWKKFVGEGIPYQCTCPNLPKGETVLASERGDILKREFDYKRRKLMPKQEELLELITAKNQDLSEADIAKQLKQTKLEDLDLIRIELDSLCRLGFLSKKSRQLGSLTVYSLSDRYRKYHQTFS